MYNSTKFFARNGLGGTEEGSSLLEVVRKLALALSTKYHSPVSYWMQMSLVDLYEWARLALEQVEREQIASAGQQEVGPGF